MTERRKKEKEEKKQKSRVVVSLLRMVLLLSCYRGGASERQEDRSRTLHDRNQTSRTLRQKKEPKKSFFRRALPWLVSQRGIERLVDRGKHSQASEGLSHRGTNSNHSKQEPQRLFH